MFETSKSSIKCIKEHERQQWYKMYKNDKKHFKTE